MFQSGFTSNSGTVAAILVEGRRDRLGSAQPRLDHRRCPAVPSRDQRCSSIATRSTPTGCSPRPATPGRRQLLDHRRGVLDGRRHRAAARPGGGRRAARRDHDGRRRARQRGARRRAARARSITSGCTGASTSRSAPCRRRSACSAGSSPGRPHLIEWLQNRGRPYLFSTSAPPVGDGGVHRRARRDRRRARASRTSVVEHRRAQGRACTSWGSTPARARPRSPR